MGAYVWNERALKLMLPALRLRGFDGRIILGGPQVSYADQGLEVLYPEVDIFVCGYGEDALARLTAAAEPLALHGVHFANDQDQRTRAEESLEQLPSPYLTGELPIKNGQALFRSR